MQDISIDASDLRESSFYGLFNKRRVALTTRKYTRRQDYGRSYHGHNYMAFYGLCSNSLRTCLSLPLSAQTSISRLGTSTNIIHNCVSSSRFRSFRRPHTKIRHPSKMVLSSMERRMGTQNITHLISLNRQRPYRYPTTHLYTKRDNLSRCHRHSRRVIWLFLKQKNIESNLYLTALYILKLFSFLIPKLTPLCQLGAFYFCYTMNTWKNLHIFPKQNLTISPRHLVSMLCHLKKPFYI